MNVIVNLTKNHSSTDRFNSKKGGKTVFDHRYKWSEDIPTNDIVLFQVCGDNFL